MNCSSLFNLRVRLRDCYREPARINCVGESLLQAMKFRKYIAAGLALSMIVAIMGATVTSSICLRSHQPMTCATDNGSDASALQKSSCCKVTHALVQLDVTAKPVAKAHAVQPTLSGDFTHAFHTERATERIAAAAVTRSDSPPLPLAIAACTVLRI